MFKNTLKHLAVSVALEDEATVVVAVEKEYVWYGILENPKELNAALTNQTQSQSNMRASKGQSRVRMVIAPEQKPEYVLTVKANTDGDKLSRNEVSLPCTKDMWLCYRAASGESMDKIRYTFDAGDGLVWEVDHFTQADGVTPKRWVKIDLEVKKELSVFPKLPITLSSVIFSPTGKYSEKDQKSIDTLYREIFVNRL
jgi:CYTH domain-containing protein